METQLKVDLTELVYDYLEGRVREGRIELMLGEVIELIDEALEQEFQRGVTHSFGRFGSFA